MNAPVKPVDKLKAELSKQEAPQESSLTNLIQKATKELGRALPAHLSPERMTRIALTTIRLNPELARCTPESFMGSLFVLAQLGLEPINGLAYILPFNNRRKVGNEWKSVKEAQVIIGYKGCLSLFYRHNSALSIDVQAVHENDEFQYEHGSKSFLRHRPAMKNRGPEIGFYAIARLAGGASLFHFMSKDDALEHGKAHSKTYDSKAEKFYDSSPWVSEFTAMAKKTVLLQLSKLLPLSFELQRAITVDETSRDYRDGIDSALDLPITTTWKKSEDGGAELPEKRAEQAQGAAADNQASPVAAQPEPKADPESFDAFVGK